MARSVRLRTDAATAAIQIRGSVDRSITEQTRPRRRTESMMTKVHRKAAGGHPMKGPVSARSMVRIGAGAEAATALDEWEAEGGAPAGAGRAGENDASPRPSLDRLLLERLGAALVSEWSNLPARLQRTVYERAVSVTSPSNRPTIRRQMARFLHDHKNRARRAPPPETALADGVHGTTP
jgi:hypothetical protein